MQSNVFLSSRSLQWIIIVRSDGVIIGPVFCNVVAENRFSSMVTTDIEDIRNSGILLVDLGRRGRTVD